MDNTHLQTSNGGLSMRRTFLTLLGGFAAFAILTASYATADLPATNADGGAPIVTVE